MLPEQNINILNVEVTTQPSLTYKLDVENGTIIGQTDGLDAMKQVVNKILGTERYAYVVYSPKYGIELESLVGKDFGYVTAVLEQKITEALLEDERILSVSDFNITKTSVDTLIASFTVMTVEGNVKMSTEVQI